MILIFRIALPSIAMLFPLMSHAALVGCGEGRQLVQNLEIQKTSLCRASGLYAPNFVAYDGEKGICIYSPDQSVKSPGVYRACAKYSETHRGSLEIVYAQSQGAE